MVSIQQPVEDIHILIAGDAENGSADAATRPHPASPQRNIPTSASNDDAKPSPRQQTLSVAASDLSYMTPQANRIPSAYAGDSTPTTPAEPSSSATLAMCDVVKLCELNRRQIQEAEEKLLALLTKQQALIHAQGILEITAVISSLSTPLGFHRGRPIASLLIYRSLLYWGLLQPPPPTPPEAPLTSASPSHQEDVLNRLLAAISSQLAPEASSPAPALSPPSHHDRIVHLALWLTNIATLLFMLHRCLPRASRRPPLAEPQPQPPAPPQQQQHQQQQQQQQQSGGGLARGLQSSNVGRVLEGLGRRISFLMVHPSEASSLGSATQGILSPHRTPGSTTSAPSPSGSYRTASGMDYTPDPPLDRRMGSRPSSRDSSVDEAGLSTTSSVGGGGNGGGGLLHALKGHLEGLLGATYRALREAAKRHLAADLAGCMLGPQEGGLEPFTLEEDGGGEASGGGLAPGEERLMAMRPWCAVVSGLNEVLEALKAAHLPRPLLHALMAQMLGHVNAQLFNQLLLRPECCSSSNAHYVVEGLTKVDAWLLEVGPHTLGPAALDCLPHIRQAATMLLVENKGRLSADDITAHLCPALTGRQLYRLATTFWDDSGSTESVSGEVLEELKGEVPNNGGLIVTFQLEEDRELPFLPGGRLLLEALSTCSDKELLAGIPVPPVLLAGGVPPEVYRYLQEDLQPTYTA